MSWLQKLYDTYEATQGNALFSEDDRPVPVSHTQQRAHIRVVLDGEGNFKSASVLENMPLITIPATQASAGRTGTKDAPHPLIDKIQYCAGDYKEHGGLKPDCHSSYLSLLRQWCASPDAHEKARAVLRYVEKETLVKDLVAEKVLHTDDRGILLTSWTRPEPIPAIFRILTGKEDKRQNKKIQDQGDALVCWVVEAPDEAQSETWTDESLRRSWIEFEARRATVRDLCYVTGETVAPAEQHPKRLRNPGDGAKLISSNDKNGFTFRGRFTDNSGTQACAVGYEVSQKAHNALRWLIARQGYRHGTQAYVAWAVSGKPVPPVLGEFDVLDDGGIPEAPEDAAVLLVPSSAAGSPDYTRNLGQSYARRLDKYMAGYGDINDPTEDIVVMGLDSATPGRMAITFYRELKGSEFLARLKSWHSAMAWPQVKFAQEKNGKKVKPVIAVFAPAPIAIAKAAFGRRLDDKLSSSTIERLVPCIIDGRHLPHDLVESCARRAIRRFGMSPGEWGRTLDVACAVFKGFHATNPKEEERRFYDMSLEPTRTSRDYLFGRLLAIAENIEQMALKAAEENRPTSAMRLFQRFADHPASTWLRLEKALIPYKKRLQSSNAGFLVNRDKLLNEIADLFRTEDFTNDDPLSPEFLLAYRCQSRALLTKSELTSAASEGEKE